jgi:hypothetical protein
MSPCELMNAIDSVVDVEVNTTDASPFLRRGSRRSISWSYSKNILPTQWSF